jgi:hypothetical protein
MSTISEKRYAAAALASVSLIWGHNFMMQNPPRLRESVSIRVAWLALHERLSRWQFLAVVTSLFGLLILIQPWNLASGLAVSLLAACTGMFWGVSVVYMKNLRGCNWGNIRRLWRRPA